MPKYIAFDWEQRSLSGLEAVASKGRVQVGRCFEMQWPADRTDDQSTGDWLRQELDNLGIGAQKVLVSLPREEVVVRQIEVPDVPDEELPDLVRLQAETKLSTSIDRLVIDYLPLPRVEGETSRLVLLCTLGLDRLEEIRSILTTAGLELAQIGVSSAATGELVSRIESSRGFDPEETSLTVTRHGKRVEISLMRQRHLLFTHSAQLTGDDDEQDSKLASAEIRRSLGAHSRLNADFAVARAWAIGTETENRLFSQSIAGQLGCDVGVIDPLANSLVTFDRSGQVDAIASHAPYGGPLGMLLAVEDPQVDSVDFLSPRQRIVRPDRRNLKTGLIAAGVAAALLLVYGGTQWRAASLRRDASEQRDKLTRLSEMIKQGRPTVEAARLIDDWEDHNADWLTQMIHVNEALPGRERIVLTNYRFTPSAGNAAGHIHADGIARSDRDVFALYQQLSDHGYRVQPQAVTRTSKDSDYPYAFQMELDVVMAQE